MVDEQIKEGSAQGVDRFNQADIEVGVGRCLQQSGGEVCKMENKTPCRIHHRLAYNPGSGNLSFADVLGCIVLCQDEPGRVS